MKSLLTIIFCLFALSTCNLAYADDAQDSIAHQERYTTDELTAHSAIYLELFGSGILYSLNYDYRFADFFAVRAGLEYIPLTSNNGDASLSVSLFAIPLMAYYLLNYNSVNLELGVGATIFTGNISLSIKNSGISGNSSGVMPVGDIGFRFEPKTGGFMFKIAYTPFLETIHQIIPFGFAFGYAF